MGPFFLAKKTDKTAAYSKDRCRAIFNKVIKNEGYNFLAYDYGNSSLNFYDDNIRQGNKAAFVLYRCRGKECKERIYQCSSEYNDAPVIERRL